MRERAFLKILDDYGNEIENELVNYLREKRRDALPHEFIAQVYDRLEDYVLRSGIRLASCITVLIFEGYRDNDRPDCGILKVCAGIELYRHAILIHDDLVDRDDLRRGDNTFHKLFGALSNRFGESVGIFTGNIVYTLALDCILGSSFNRDLLYDSIRTLNGAFQSVNESQMLDVLFEYTEPGEAEWYRMASKRAASLFRATMLIGAILANAPDKDKEIYTDAAEHMGYAFDIHDDIMGTFATEEEYGRTPNGDIKLFKKPLHLIYTLSNEQEDVVSELKAMIQQDDFHRVRALIREYGLEPAKDKARAHAQNAVALIEHTALNSKIKQFFRDLICSIAADLEQY